MTYTEGDLRAAYRSGFKHGQETVSTRHERQFISGFKTEKYKIIRPAYHNSMFIRWYKDHQS